MARYDKQFRDIFYKTSVGAGDIISLDVLQQPLRPIRSSALQFARINADFKSLTPRGQGPMMRIQRRVAGRIAGRLGQTLIPQSMGPITRIANRMYGKFATMKVQNHYNYKIGIDIEFNGRVMTEYMKQELSKSQGGRLEREYQKALTDMAKKKINIEEFSLPELMQDIQYNLLGISGGETPGAPIKTGNLRNSIRFRGINYSPKRGVASGKITVGSSAGNRSGEADQAPYWWKTVYGGYYTPNNTFFTPPKNRAWLGKGIKGALTAYFPDMGYELKVNGKTRQDKGNFYAYQPDPPKKDDYEISYENQIKDPSGLLDFLLGDED